MNPTVLVHVTAGSYGRDMSSDNPIGADNQQETRSKALDPGWIVGFTDGEGCFSVSIHRNDFARPTRGWHVQPTFQVSQHADHSGVLHDLRECFSCGSVRRKSPRSKRRGLCGAQHHPARRADYSVLRGTMSFGSSEMTSTSSPTSFGRYELESIIAQRSSIGS